MTRPAYLPRTLPGHYSRMPAGSAPNWLIAMKLAILSDVHGNPIALDAVLAHIDRGGGVDGYWVLGDLVAQGFAPAATLERLTALPAARFVRGNTDRYVVTGSWPNPNVTVADAQADPGLVPALVAVAQGFAWTRGALSPGGWIDWLAALPLEQRATLPDGTRLLGVHAAPGDDDGSGIASDTSDDELRRLLAGCEADLVCVSHTHQALDRTVDGVRAINPGSVSNPRVDESGDRRASYATIDAGSGDLRVSMHRVEYDTHAVVQAIRASDFFPNPEWLIGKFSA